MADTDTEEESSAGYVRLRVRCFESEEQIRAFGRSFTIAFRELHRTNTRKFVSDANTLRYNHGQRWTHAANPDARDTGMRTFSTELQVQHKDIVENDLDAISRSMLPAVEDMHRQFALNMYGFIGEVAESVGNVVSNKETGSSAASFLEMLQKIKFGIDRDGEVSLPEIHMGPSQAEKFVTELKAQPPEFSEEVERIKTAKIEEARQEEAARKARFKSLPE